MRELVLLTEMGDLVITWEADNDEEMAKVIQRKMDQGVRFFIVKPFEKSEVKVTKLEDIQGREVFIRDEDLEIMFTEGKIGLVKRIQQTTIQTFGHAKTAIEAAKGTTMGVRPFVGG